MQDVKKMACVQGNPEMLKEQCLVAVGSWASQVCLAHPKMRADFDALLEKGKTLPVEFFQHVDARSEKAIAVSIKNA